MQSVRNVCKKSKTAADIRDAIKQLSQREIRSKLRIYNLNERGHTEDLKDRLIRFEIKRLLPELNINWSNEHDDAVVMETEITSEDQEEQSDSEEEPVQVNKHESKTKKLQQIEAVIHEEPHVEAEDMHIHNGRETTDLQNARPARVYVHREVRMLHQSDGLRQYQTAHSSNFMFARSEENANQLQHLTTSRKTPLAKPQAITCKRVRSQNQQQDPNLDQIDQLSSEAEEERIPREWFTPRTSTIKKKSSSKPRRHSEIIEESESESEIGNASIYKSAQHEPYADPAHNRLQIEQRRERRATPTNMYKSIRKGKGSPNESKSDREKALEKELRRCRKLLEEQRIESSESSESGEEQMVQRKSRKKKTTRKVEIVQRKSISSSSTEMSTEESSEEEYYRERRPRHSRTATESQLREQMRKSIDDYKLSFNGDKKQAEVFLELLDECHSTCKAPDELWLQAIGRVFKGKAHTWYKNHKAEFSSWKKFIRAFEKRFFGMIDDDDLYDELRMKVQSKNESIQDYIDSFKQSISRLRHPPSISTQLSIVYKNLLPGYRMHLIGRSVDSFRKLEKYGREYEREKLINERQSHLISNKTEKVAEVKEKEEEKENKNKKKQNKNKSTEKQEEKKEEQSSEVAAAGTNCPNVVQQGQGGANAKYQGAYRGPPQQPRNNWQPGGTTPHQPTQGGGGDVKRQQQPSIQAQPQDTSQQIEIRCHLCKEVGHRVINCPLTTCYKCQQQGHMASACPQRQSREFYCYRCQKPNVIFRNCPNCNPQPSGNGQAEGQQTRPAPSAQQ